jgi:hypothetical protein
LIGVVQFHESLGIVSVQHCRIRILRRPHNRDLSGA